MSRVLLSASPQALSMMVPALSLAATAATGNGDGSVVTAGADSVERSRVRVPPADVRK